MKLNSNLLVMALLGSGCAITVSAAPLTPEEALGRAIASGPSRLAAATPAAFSLGGSFGEEDAPALFVFNSSGSDSGFIVVAADDAVSPLLGYADSGDFSLADASPEFLWWLDEYTCQINRLRETDARQVADFTEREPVEPLVKTKWNQDDPYNRLCPKIDGQRSYVGCVATAVAQVVNYFRCPAEYGYGLYSYTYRGTEYSFDYEYTSFDWDNMALQVPFAPEDYPGSRTDINNALATLSYACGVGVDMMYSPYGSGAHSFRIPRMLVAHFGFDAGARYLMRDFYGFTEWNDMIYNELAEGRPVLYAGQSDGGGHEFVCDGYSSDNLFHINWGWGGMSDGYFLLAVLDPEQQGAGGSVTGNGFNASQDVIIGLQPAKEGSSRAIPLFAYGSFTPVYDEEESLWGVTFDNGEQGAYLFGVNDMNLWFGLCAEGTDGERHYCADGPAEVPGTGHGTNIKGIGGYYVDIASMNLPQGAYTAYPVVREDDGDWQKIHIPAGKARSVEMTVDADGNISFAQGVPDVSSELYVTDFGMGYPDCEDCPPLYSFSITNSGELPYEGDILMNVVEPATMETVSVCRFGVNVAVGQTVDESFDWNAWVPGGEYVFSFTLPDGTPVSEPFTGLVETISYPEIVVRNMTLPESMRSDRRNSLKCEVENLSATEYSGCILLEVIDPESGAVLERRPYNNIRVGSNATISKTLQWRPSTVGEGTYLMAVRNDREQLIYGPVEITLSDGSGIEAVAEAIPDSFDVYSVDGVCLRRGASRDDLRSLRSGIYILRAGEAAVRIRL